MHLYGFVKMFYKEQWPKPGTRDVIWVIFRYRIVSAAEVPPGRYLTGRGKPAAVTAVLLLDRCGCMMSYPSYPKMAGK